MKIYRILGKRGRITIPYDIRKEVGFKTDDVLSFSLNSDNTVTVKREKVCDNCRETYAPLGVEEFVESLTPSEQQKFIVLLSTRWAENVGNKSIK